MTQGVSSVSLENPVESFPSSIIAVVHGVVKLNETDRCYQWCWFTQDHLNAHIGHKAHAPWRAKLICFQNGFPLVSFELLVNKVPNILPDNLSSKSIAPRAKLRRVKSLISNRSATACIKRKTSPLPWSFSWFFCFLRCSLLFLCQWVDCSSPAKEQRGSWVGKTSKTLR